MTVRAGSRGGKNTGSQRISLCDLCLRSRLTIQRKRTFRADAGLRARK